MSVESKQKKANHSTSLATTLATAFVILSVVSLLVLGGVEIYLNFQSQQELVASQQEGVALQAASEVSAFVERITEVLVTASQLGLPFAENQDQADQRLLLEGILGQDPAFQELALLNSRGQEVVKSARLAVFSEDDLESQAGTALFQQVSQDEQYIGTVHIDEITREPRLTIAVPIQNVFDEFQGALVAEVNLRFMWDLVDSLEVGENGLGYVVDRQGNLIAFSDISRVLRGENVSHLTEVIEFINHQEMTEEAGADFVEGILGTDVLATHVPLGTPDWAVIVELPVEEVYNDIIQGIIISSSVLLIVAVLAGISGVYMARRLATPLLNLTDTATRIAEGDTTLKADVVGPTEVVRLAGAFNSMTTQLQELIGSLEERVADKTQRLEIVATLNERLSAILDFDKLLLELVNQVKEEFGYYHAHVYILDPNKEDLVMTAGAGEPGAIMKAEGHHIPLNTPTSLVARAARSGKIVWVDNVRKASDWLPNPLLPDTYSEMAVPIILSDEVVGVLDVQENKIGGLDESDASLLRSLANQVAVAIRNARLFEEVENALAEAHAAQERYVEQSWDKSKMVARKGQYLYAKPDASPLTRTRKQLLDETKQQALKQHRSKLVSDKEGQEQCIVAPIGLRDKMIGTLQLQASDNDQKWSEDDLAIIQVIIDQLAQTADNIRLFEETREQASREQVIREITDKLRTAPTLERLVTIATEELGEHLSATHAKLELGLDDDRSPEKQNGTERVQI